MQSVKLVVRQVGIPNVALDIISEADLNEYIKYQLASQGYKLFDTHYLSEVKDANGSTQGYKFALWFTADEEVKAKAK